ncbi:MAG: AAA family ATPase [Arcobacteraceae bacterium]
MKIKKIKWNNHPILGDLELDFMNNITGKPYDNIIFAGENGTGKTTILESLSIFLNLGSFEYFEYIEYIVDSQNIKIIPQLENDFFKHGFHKRIVDSNPEVRINTNRSSNKQQLETDILDLRYYGCVFSKARADYQTKKITSTTTKELDIDKYDMDNEDDFTSLKQLIVDIDHEDKDNYAQVNKSNGANPISWDSFYLTSKMFRFSNSFDNFFEKINFNKIDNRNGEKSIVFTKNSNDISIDNLSTGEKQIVFRGAYLLKNLNNLQGAICMIDEPELSMHPKWQQKIFNYYTSLFEDYSGVQKVQLLFATHSTEVLKSALKNKDNNLVIVLKENNGVISVNKVESPSILPTITNAETNYLAFDVVSNDYHIELYGYLQNKINETRVKQTDDYIKTQSDYNSSLHFKNSSNPRGTSYDTLPTYIRNAIDHPSTSMSFTDEELRKSIELLIKICN